MHRRSLLAAATAALVVSGAFPARSGDEDHANHMHVDAGDFLLHNPRVFAATPKAPTAAAFLGIQNVSGHDDRLIAVETTAARRAELHGSTTGEDGVTRMHRIEGGVAIADDALVFFAPRGKHIMLMGLTVPTAEGASLPLTLVFEHAGRVEVELPVTNTPQSAGADGGHGAHGDHATHGN